MMWNKLRMISGQFSTYFPPVLKLNGNTVPAPEEVTLANQFYSVSKRDPSESNVRLRNSQKKFDIDFLNLTTFHML